MCVYGLFCYANLGCIYNSGTEARPPKQVLYACCTSVSSQFAIALENNCRCCAEDANFDHDMLCMPFLRSGLEQGNSWYRAGVFDTC